MLVSEIMDARHPYIYENELATKARAMIRNLSLRILPVTDKDKKVLGKVSRRDVMTISSSKSPIRVRGIKTPARHMALMEDHVAATIRAMLRVDAWLAPVVDSLGDKTYRGVVGLDNYINSMIKTNPEKLTKDASEIMTTDVASCSPDDEVDNIWRLMQQKRLAGLPVVRKDKLVGMITQKDLLKSGSTMPTFEAKKGRYRDSPKILTAMETQVVAVEPHIKAIRVAKVMISKDVGRVPVKDEAGRLVGIIDREDIARILVM